MCELLVFVRDKTNPNDPYKDARLYKAGDVVVVVPDGWKWGLRELDNPDWRIIKIPNLAPAALQNLMDVGFNLGSLDAKNVLRRRSNRLDLAAITDAGFADFLADDKRQQPSFTLGSAKVLAAVALKAPVNDAAVIGNPLEVIG